jgi:small subunit ribosomal protein S13
LHSIEKKKKRKRKMSHLFGVLMNPKKPLWICLCQIPGVGKKTAFEACKNVGLAPTVSWENITENQGRALYQWLDSLNVPLAMDFKKMRKNKKEALMALGSYRGIRLRQGLPVRGQNTHANAKTARKRLS